MMSRYDMLHSYDYDYRGICSTCDHVATCGLRSNNEKPLIFCEEFACNSSVPDHRNGENFAIPRSYESQIAVKRPEHARLAYIGLCRNCAILATCTFLKSGGGTWQCDVYQEGTS